MTRSCPPFRAFLPGASAILSPKGAGHIRTVIYLDVLLLVNFVTTALFLLAAGLLSGVTASGWRVTAGAALGAAASLILLAPTAPWPLGLAYQTATGAVIVLAAYGWPGARCFLRLAAWFTALHLALTGAVLLPGAHSNNFSVYLPLSPGLLLLCAGGVYLAVQGVLRLLGRRGGQTVPATLLVAGAALGLLRHRLLGAGAAFGPGRGAGAVCRRPKRPAAPAGGLLIRLLFRRYRPASAGACAAVCSLHHRRGPLHPARRPRRPRVSPGPAPLRRFLRPPTPAGRLGDAGGGGSDVLNLN